ERFGVVPELAVTVNGPRHDLDLRAGDDVEVAPALGLNDLAADGSRRRVEPHRLLEGSASIGHLAEPLIRVRRRGDDFVDLGLDAVTLPGCLGKAIERPAERAGGGLVAGTDEGDDVVLDLAGLQPFRPLGLE